MLLWVNKERYKQLFRQKVGLSSILVNVRIIYLDLKTLGAVAKVAAVIKVPNINKKWAATVIPNTKNDPK